MTTQVLYTLTSTAFALAAVFPFTAGNVQDGCALMGVATLLSIAAGIEKIAKAKDNG